MNINWFGQSCFRMTGKDVSLLIDPFPKEIGLKPPRLNDNIFLVSHDHYDHNNVAGLDQESFLINGPGEYEKKGVHVEGISSFHDNSQGSQRGPNIIYVIRMEDLRLCHLGDLGQKQLTGEQVEAIGEIDILFIPIGGSYTIDGKEAVEIVKQIEPKVIIPMHYKIDGLTIDLEGPQKFIKEIGMDAEKVETFKISNKNLPTEEMKLAMFQI